MTAEKITVEEAIEVLRNAAFLGTEEALQKDNDAVEMAIEALEKNIPKKPFYNSPNETWYCTVCHRAVSVVQKHCEYCGKVIDWSEVEK